MSRLKLLFCVLFITTLVTAQPVLIDKVIGVVGKYPVLLSDLQNAMLEQEENMNIDRCKAFELLVFQKLLIAQADRDSVTVSDAEVETELNRRMAIFINKFGSEEKLEQFYGKRTNVLKDDFRADVHEKLLAERMMGRISGDVKLTPAEVRLFYNHIPNDSLPLINSEVELQQLVKKPHYSAQAKLEAKELIESYRQRVVSGQTGMRILANLYSEDPGSNKNGGEIPNVSRGTMVPEFEAVAFRLKNGEVSQVFETAFGYHFIQLIQRKGELLDLRHILIIPKMTNDDFFACKGQMDSIQKAIKDGSITFEEAVKKFSDDADTKQNAGLMVNRQSASTKFDNESLTDIDQNLVVTLNSMQINDISKPMQFMTEDGKPAFRILKLKNRIDPHKANLKEDYQKISMMAVYQKSLDLRKEWIKKRSKITYIKLDPAYTCKFEQDWVISN